MKDVLKRLYELNRKYKVSGELDEEEYAELTELLELAKENINSIDDDYAGYCLTERYINAKPWRQIADEMGHYTDDAIRKCCERAIKRYMLNNGAVANATPPLFLYHINKILMHPCVAV